MICAGGKCIGERHAPEHFLKHRLEFPKVPMMRRTLLRDAAIFDGVSDQLLEGHHVLIEDDRIRALVPFGEAPPAVDCVIDAKGLFLLPGFIDAHVHACASDVRVDIGDQKPVTLIAHHAAVRLGRMLDRGFTTVRDCGGADHGLAAAIREGLVRGPSLLFCGKMLSQTGGHGDVRQSNARWPNEEDVGSCGCGYSGHLSATTDGVDSVRRVVRSFLHRGAHFIKFAVSGGVATVGSMASLQFADDEIRAIVDEVTRHGTYCTAHAHPDAAIRRAIDLGVHCIEHGTMISAETARLAAEQGTFIVPTLSVGASFLRQGAALGLPSSTLEKARAASERTIDGLVNMNEAGVAVGLGSDLLGEFEDNQLLEFELRREVFSPAEILRQATSVNARILQLSDEIGVIAPGARADLVLLGTNPLTDVSAVRDLRMVMRGGTMCVNRLPVMSQPIFNSLVDR